MYTTIYGKCWLQNSADDILNWIVFLFFIETRLWKGAEPYFAWEVLNFSLNFQFLL